MSEYDDVMAILQQNANKSFVKRILQKDKYPTLDAGNGQVMTHKMAWGEADGKYYVYPTVLWDGKKLVDYGPDAAWDAVMKTGNYIEFSDPKQAEWFSQRYKAAWGE